MNKQQELIAEYMKVRKIGSYLGLVRDLGIKSDAQIRQWRAGTAAIPKDHAERMWKATNLPADFIFLMYAETAKKPGEIKFWKHAAGSVLSLILIFNITEITSISEAQAIDVNQNIHYALFIMILSAALLGVVTIWKYTPKTLRPRS